MDSNEMRKMKLEEKMNEAKSWAKSAVSKVATAVDKGLDWAIKNPEKAAILGTGLAVGKKMLTKSKERTYEDKRSSYWDGRNQWELKRPMTTREQLELRRRLANGEEAYEILYDMRLLKY